MPTIVRSKSKNPANDCITAGYPIHYRQTHEVAETTDTDATPLIPPAAFLGVMNGLTINNQSCSDLVVEIEWWSAKSDCKGCTKDVPETKVESFTVLADEGINFGDGYVVDYSITGGVFVKDGCVDVMTSRATSSCCTMTGVTTQLNELVIPTI